MENTQEDIELLQQYKSGNTNAINLLIEKYKSLVTTLSHRFFLLGAEQEDLIQEGMIGLYRACQNFDEKGIASFKSFAYLCILRQMKTAIKNANRQKNLALNNALSISSENGIDFVNTTSVEDFDAKILYLPVFQNSPEDEMIKQEEQEELLQKLRDNLSPLELRILDYYLDGMKCGEIAKITKIPYKTTDNALYRLKQKLEQLQ